MADPRHSRHDGCLRVHDDAGLFGAIDLLKAGGDVVPVFLGELALEHVEQLVTRQRRDCHNTEVALGAPVEEPGQRIRLLAGEERSWRRDVNDLVHGGDATERVVQPLRAANE